MNPRIESGHVYTETLVTKYSVEAEAYLKEILGREPNIHDYRAYEIAPDEVVKGPQPGNVLANVGINQLWKRCGTTDPVWDSTHGAIGVGTDFATAQNATNTDLSGASKYYQAWAGTPTTGSSQAIVFQSTFATGNANFAWNEYSVVIPQASAATYTSGSSKQSLYVILNRKAGSGLLGTKTSAQSWTFTVTMTLA